jgi:hypothetical protein
MDDGAIVRRLSRLTKTSEQRERECMELRKSEWNDRIAIISKQPRLEGQYKAVQKAMKNGDGEALEAQLSYSSNSDVDLKNFLAILIKISREKPDQRIQLMDFLSTHENDTKKRPFFISQLKQAKEILAG